MNLADRESKPEVRKTHNRKNEHHTNQDRAGQPSIKRPADDKPEDEPEQNMNPIKHHSNFLHTIKRYSDEYKLIIKFSIKQWHQAWLDRTSY